MSNQMKIRTLIVLLLCVTVASIVIFLFGASPPSINQIVSKTQGRLSEWKKLNLQVNQGTEIKPGPAEEYLYKLGFNKNSHFYPYQEWKNILLPVFVTAASSSQVQFALNFIRSFQTYLPEYMLFLYMLDNSDQNLQLTTICNSSNCAIRHFDFSSYPSHVQDLKLSAFRPIIIQEVLNQAGAVLWLDIQAVFTSSDIKNILSQSQRVGILSWSINHPTSALTHPRMFDYFHTNQENYFFHRMVQPSNIVIYNTENIHKQLMHPWVKCALVLNCIAPIGAQSSGCRFDKKPLFRYSGCHRYDMSALNVALGMMFGFTANSYVASENDKFFQFIESEPTMLLEKDIVKNATTKTLDIATNF